jgi:hypothetical protein
VQRIWEAHRLQPHRVRAFKHWRDPRFAEKLVDVVGLYLDPTERAVVLSIDEKSQIQPLDRHQEFIRFLNAVDREVPSDKAIEAVVDNYATHCPATIKVDVAILIVALQRISIRSCRFG